MDFDILKRRFRQFGGLGLVREYARLGLVPVISRQFFGCVVKRKSFKSIYPSIRERVMPVLAEKYSAILDAYEPVSGVEKPSKIWFCWLQGIENAPIMVKACLASLQKWFPEHEIVILDSSNYFEYVKLPDYIVRKFEDGRMPAALFSDLLRLELLVNHGGTWIDSTVLCTGWVEGSENERLVRSIMDADLFFFQYAGHKGGVYTGISNWFISASAGNGALVTLRNVLYAYWRDYDCVLDYYMFHDFFGVLVRSHPEIMEKMPYASSRRSIKLLDSLGKPFDQDAWDRFTSKVCFHKLSFRLPESVVKARDSYYSHIVFHKLDD